MNATALLAIDWGTTSARAYRVDAQGVISPPRELPLGISKVEPGGFPAALAQLLGDWSQIDAPRLACGMIGSRQGWREAPYVECPVSLERLAAGLVVVEASRQENRPPLSIVPGLITQDERGTPDVMRGEETQLLGGTSSDEHVLCVLPGTHSKWAVVNHGTVADFRTFMTGELYDVLLNNSILGRMAERSATQPFGPAFDQGLSIGLEPGGLSYDLFGARTLALVGRIEPADVEPWLSGLLIGREIRDGLDWARHKYPDLPIRILGEHSLAHRYSHALKFGGQTAERGSEDAAARGLFRIAQQAKMLNE